jgi:hypothetical protein
VVFVGRGGQPQGRRPAARRDRPGRVLDDPYLPAVPDSANWTNLWAIAQGGNSVWAVGSYVDPATDNNSLVLRETGGTWTVNPAPNPRSGSNILGGITSIDGQLWAAGIYDDGGSEIPLVLHT